MQFKCPLHFSIRAILILGSLAMFSIGGVSTAQPSKHPKTKAKATEKVQPLVCESPTLKPGQSSQTAFSAHTVTLSWNASVVSPGHGKADGYCIYRSPTPGGVQFKNNKCNDCELLNQTPLPGTTCVDDTLTVAPNDYFVYYVVAAVNTGGMSGPSNEASAPIPANKPASSPPKGIPFCNGTTSPEKIENKPQK